MKQAFTSILSGIKALLHKNQWKEALIFFYFILLASGFWLMQSLQQEYEININIPVRYKNIPKDLTFTETPPETIDVKVKDRGSILLNYTIGRKFAPIDIDLKNGQIKQDKAFIGKKEIENDIKKQLMTTSSILSFDPQDLRLSFSKQIQKKLPVNFLGDIRTLPGFKISGPIQIEPGIITAYAKHFVLDTIDSVQTVFTEIKKANKTVTQTIHLKKIDGVIFDPGSVVVTIPIEEYTEKQIEVPIVFSNVPPHYRVRSFPSVVRVSCSVPLSSFKELTDDQFQITIPFSELEQSTTGMISIGLTNKPESVDRATLVPDRIEFILEQTQ